MINKVLWPYTNHLPIFTGEKMLSHQNITNIIPGLRMFTMSDQFREYCQCNSTVENIPFSLNRNWHYFCSVLKIILPHCSTTSECKNNTTHNNKETDVFYLFMIYLHANYHCKRTATFLVTKTKQSKLGWLCWLVYETSLNCLIITKTMLLTAHAFWFSSSLYIKL